MYCIDVPPQNVDGMRTGILAMEMLTDITRVGTAPMLGAETISKIYSVLTRIKAEMLA